MSLVGPRVSALSKLSRRRRQVPSILINGALYLFPCAEQHRDFCRFSPDPPLACHGSQSGLGQYGLRLKWAKGRFW